MVIAIAAIIDIILIVVFILIAKTYSDKGFLKSLIGLAGNIVAIVLALIFSAQLGEYINTNFVEKFAEQQLVNTLSSNDKSTDASLEKIDLDGLFNDRPSHFENILKYLKIDVDKANEVYNSFKTQGLEKAKASIISYIVSPASALISRIIAFLLIFLAAKIVIAILWWISNMLVNIPIIRRFDRLGGTLVGIAAAIVITFVLVAVVNLTLNFVLRNVKIEDKVEITERTIVYKNLNNINPLNRFFENWEQGENEE